MVGRMNIFRTLSIADGLFSKQNPPHLYLARFLFVPAESVAKINDSFVGRGILDAPLV